MKRNIEAIISGNFREKHKAAAALGDLCRNGSLVDHQEIRLVVTPFLPGLFSHLRVLVCNGNALCKANAATALSCLCHMDASRKETIARIGGTTALVGLLRHGDTVGKAAAIGALRNLSSGSQINHEAIIKEGGISLIIGLLTEGNPEMKRCAAGIIQNLSSNNAEFKERMSTEDALLPSLITLLRDGDDAGKGAATCALRNLAYNNDSNKQAIAKNGGVEALLVLVRDGDADSKRNACNALRNLCCGIASAASRELVAAEGGILHIVNLLRNGDTASEVAAVGALRILSLENSAKIRIASDDGIAPLVALLKNCDDNKGKVSAAWTLGNLASDESMIEPIVLEDAIPPLVALLASCTDCDGKTAAASALRNLSQDNASDVGELIVKVDGGVVISALVCLMRDGDGRGKTVAALTLGNMSCSENASGCYSIYERISSEGGIPLLVSLLRSSSSAGQSAGQSANPAVAALMLSNLARLACNQVPITSKEFGGVPVLIAMLRDGDTQSKLQASNALWNLAYNCASNKELIAAEGGIAALIAVVYVANVDDNLRQAALGALRELAKDNTNNMAAIYVTFKICEICSKKKKMPSIGSGSGSGDMASSTPTAPATATSTATGTDTMAFGSLGSRPKGFVDVADNKPKGDAAPRAPNPPNPPVAAGAEEMPNTSVDVAVVAPAAAGANLAKGLVPNDGAATVGSTGFSFTIPSLTPTVPANTTATTTTGSVASTSNAGFSMGTSTTDAAPRRKSKANLSKLLNKTGTTPATTATVPATVAKLKSTDGDRAVFAFVR